MSNQPNQCDNLALTQRPLVIVRRWWIFAFIVSLIVFLSALLFLNNEAHAKPNEGDQGGGNPRGDASNNGGHHSGGGPNNGGPNNGGRGHFGGGDSNRGGSGGSDLGKDIPSKRPGEALRNQGRNQGDHGLSGGQPKDTALGGANHSNIARGNNAGNSLGDFANEATGPSNDPITTMGGATDMAAEIAKPIVAKPIGKNAESSVNDSVNEASPVSEQLGSAPNPLSDVAGAVDPPAVGASEPLAQVRDPAQLRRDPLPAAEVFSLSAQPSSWSLPEQSLASQPVLLSAPISTKEANSIPIASTLVAISASLEDDLSLTQTPHSLPAKAVSVARGSSGGSGGSSSFPASGLLVVGGSSGGLSNSSSSAGFKLVGALALLPVLLTLGVANTCGRLGYLLSLVRSSCWLSNDLDSTPLPEVRPFFLRCASQALLTCPLSPVLVSQERE